jgi:proteasome lid subunit RPN8/RPN11
MRLSKSLATAIIKHAHECAPAESCGVIISANGRRRYVPCRNIMAGTAAGTDRFEICPFDLAAAEDAGELLAYVHSHPNAGNRPSHADMIGIEREGLPWVIVSLPSGAISVTYPTGQRLPLVGRTFCHGIVDCYTLIQDYYATRCGIELPDFDRHDDWWKRGADGQPGADLYLQHVEAQGFVRVGDGRAEWQPHDLVLMQVLSEQANHAAVFDADRPGLILHHLWGRLSGHDVWGGDWARRTVGIYRHRSLMGQA